MILSTKTNQIKGMITICSFTLFEKCLFSCLLTVRVIDTHFQVHLFHFTLWPLLSSLFCNSFIHFLQEMEMRIQLHEPVDPFDWWLIGLERWFNDCYSICTLFLFSSPFRCRCKHEIEKRNSICFGCVCELNWSPTIWNWCPWWYQHHDHVHEESKYDLRSIGLQTLNGIISFHSISHIK